MGKQKDNCGDKSTSEIGHNFENYISLLYNSLGFNVKTNVCIAGQQIDILAEKLIRGIGLTRIVIECKYRTKGMVSNQDVFDFISMIKSIKDNERITHGIIVSNKGFSKEAMAAAEVSGLVELFMSSAIENQLFEVHDVYRNYVNEFEKTDIFNNFVYMRAIVELNQTGEKKQISDILTDVIDWIDNSSVNFISILADYGAGKTTLLERIKYEYAKKLVLGQSNLKPFLIFLKDFHTYNNLDALIEDYIRKEFQREIPLSLFWKMATEGQLIFLLDGFDEMAPQVDKDRRKEHFLILSKFFSLKSKVILTCRPSYFVTVEEYESIIYTVNELNAPVKQTFKDTKRGKSLSKRFEYFALHRRLFSRFINYKPIEPIPKSDTAVVELQSFNESQIDTFLKKFEDLFQKKCGCGWEMVKKFLMAIYDLRDLMTRPILLTMITETVLFGKLDVSSTITSLGPSSLYELYTSMKLEVDWHKGESRKFLTKTQRRLFAEAIALGMLENDKLYISYDEILFVIEKHPEVMKNLRERLAAVSVEEIATDIQICTFLSRDQSGFFRFSHKSLMEFFVARYLKEILQQNGKAGNLAIFLPKEILYFLGAFGIIEPNVRQIFINWFKNKQVLTNQETTFRRNMGGCILYSGPEQKNLILKDSEISFIDVLKTVFYKSKFINNAIISTRWNTVVTKSSQFLDVKFTESELKEWNAIDSIFNIDFLDCSFDRFEVINSEIEFSGVKSFLNNLDFENCSVKMTNGLSGKDWKITDSNVLFELNNTTIEGINFTNSQTHLSGRSLLVKNSCFKNSPVEVDGRIEFRKCNFSSGNISIPAIHGSSISVSDTKFEDVSINVFLRYHISSQSFSNCLYHRCKVFGICMSERQYKLSEFRNCTGLIFIAEPTSRSLFSTDKFYIKKSESFYLVKEKYLWEDAKKNKLFSFVKQNMDSEFFNKLLKLRSD